MENPYGVQTLGGSKLYTGCNREKNIFSKTRKGNVKLS
jgi:hypothetical protein